MCGLLGMLTANSNAAQFVGAIKTALPKNGKIIIICSSKMAKN